MLNFGVLGDFFFFLFIFLGPHAHHMEVPRLGIQSELLLPAYTTATATPDPSCVFDLYHSSWQRQIFNPLSEARGRTCNLMVPNQIHFHCAMTGTPRRLRIIIFFTLNIVKIQIFRFFTRLQIHQVISKQSFIEGKFTYLSIQLEKYEQSKHPCNHHPDQNTELFQHLPKFPWALFISTALHTRDNYSNVFEICFYLF